MNDAKMCKAMQSICMGKRNCERLRHVFVKDGRMYATDNYMIVAVQDKFTESHGHDGIEVLKESNGIFEIGPDENMPEMPDLERYFELSRKSPLAMQAIRIRSSFVKKAFRVFDACELTPYIELCEDRKMYMCAADSDAMVMAVIMGLKD